MVTKEKTAECLGRLEALKFFPAGARAKAEVGRILIEVCGDDQSATAAVDRILGAYDEWMGPAAFRDACRGARPLRYFDPRTITGEKVRPC